MAKIQVSGPSGEREVEYQREASLELSAGEQLTVTSAAIEQIIPDGNDVLLLLGDGSTVRIVDLLVATGGVLPALVPGASGQLTSIDFMPSGVPSVQEEVRQSLLSEGRSGTPKEVVQTGVGDGGGNARDAATPVSLVSGVVAGEGDVDTAVATSLVAPAAETETVTLLSTRNRLALDALDEEGAVVPPTAIFLPGAARGAWRVPGASFRFDGILWRNSGSSPGTADSEGDPWQRRGSLLDWDRDDDRFPGGPVVAGDHGQGGFSEQGAPGTRPSHGSDWNPGHELSGSHDGPTTAYDLPPWEPDLAGGTVPEGETVVGAVSAQNPEHAALRFRIVDDPAGLFALEGTELRLRERLDFENLPAGLTLLPDGAVLASVAIAVSDGVRERAKSFTIRITDRDDTGPSTGPGAASVPDGATHDAVLEPFPTASPGWWNGRRAPGLEVTNVQEVPGKFRLDPDAPVENTTAIDPSGAGNTGGPADLTLSVMSAAEDVPFVGAFAAPRPHGDAAALLAGGLGFGLKSGMTSAFALNLADVLALGGETADGKIRLTIDGDDGDAVSFVPQEGFSRLGKEGGYAAYVAAGTSARVLIDNAVGVNGV